MRRPMFFMEYFKSSSNTRPTPSLAAALQSVPFVKNVVIREYKYISRRCLYSCAGASQYYFKCIQYLMIPFF